MKNSKYLILLLIFITSLNADINKEYSFAITIYKMNKATQNRAKSVVMNTIKELSKILDEKVNVIFIDDENNLLKSFRKFEKINMMIIYPSFYLKNKDELKKIGTNPFLFYNESNQKTQYYLIANKNSNIKNIRDLKGKNFTSLTIDDTYITWLDYLTRKQFKRSYKSIIDKERMVDKNAKLLLDVYFNKVDFTVVSKVVYDDMILLNPDIKNKLIIIKKSEPIFFFGMGIFHKNTPQRLIDKYQKIIDNGIFNERFGNLHRMLNLYEIHKATFKELASLDKFYEEYIKLKSVQK